MVVERRKPKLLDRFVGCLLGLACGDALGAPVEEWTSTSIRASLGFIRDYQTTILGRGIITDDTQLSILLAQSIIQNEHFDPSQFAYHLGEWMRRVDEGEEPGRGTGQTVSLACRRLYKGAYWKRSGEFSAGNSSAVRVPPLAMFHCKKPESVLLNDAKDSCIPTHIDPLAIAGTQVYSVALARLLQSDFDNFDPIEFVKGLVEVAKPLHGQVGDVIEDLVNRLEGRSLEDLAFIVPGGPTEVTHFDNTLSLQENVRIVDRMGTGKFILQTLPAAMYSFLANPYDIESAILCSVNAGGDADTIAAMTGSLAGAFNGAQGIPIRWLHELEKKDTLIDLANMLYDLATEGHTTKDIRGWRVVE